MDLSLITIAHLQQIGLDKSGSELNLLLTHLNEQLEERVGAEIVESLSDDKLAEYLETQENSSSEELGKWLQANVPELQEIVQDEIDILLGDLAENAEDINLAA